MKIEKSNKLSRHLKIKENNSPVPEMYLGNTYISSTITSYKIENGVLTISIPIIFGEHLEEN